MISNDTFERLLLFGLAAIFAGVICHSDPARASSVVDCERIFQTEGHGTSFYEQNPTYRDAHDDSADWSFAAPESRGLSSQRLQAGIKELSKSKRLFSVLVLKGGDIVLEQYFNGSSPQQSNNIHSASKSMMSMLVGIAIDRGYIKSVDQKLSDFLPEYFSGVDRLKEQITVRHLLTMSAGLRWRDDPEHGTEYEIQNESNWVQAIAALPMVSRPGQKFFYNTGLTHLMSAIVARASGMNTCDFAHTHLFGPLGVTIEHWGRDPQGVYSGGYNLYMTPREMAKVGQLVLNGGKYNGRQIVPQAWIKDSARTAYEPYRERNGGSSWWTSDRYGYGYNWWIYPTSEQVMLIAWGYGGQMIYVVPRLDIVVVITRDTSSARDVREDPVNHEFVTKFVLH